MIKSTKGLSGYEQLAILESLEGSIKVARSNAKLCVSGLINTKIKDANLLNIDEICADKKMIKFELSPSNKKEWNSLKPE